MQGGNDLKTQLAARYGSGFLGDDFSQLFGSKTASSLGIFTAYFVSVLHIN